MHSVSQNFVMIFNGEIYNHMSLGSELDSLNQRNWHGHSDTETLLAAIEEWGLDRTLKKAKGCLQLLYGIRDKKFVFSM